jgi:nucleotide-binding universal stress UspA family protein
MVMNLFKKIMVPLDGSKNSKDALNVAIEIAKKFGGKVTLVHVYSSGGVFGAPAISDAYTEVPVAVAYRENVRQLGNKILEDGKAKVEDEGIEVETILEEGHVVQEISKMSQGSNFDLIVMGTRGRSEIAELLLGSVSNGVVQHAACPVLLVR